MLRLDFVAPVIDLPHQLLHVEAVEGRLADNQLEEDAAEGPRINLVSVPFTLQQLRRLVKRCADDGKLGFGFAHDSRQAPVRDLDLEVHFRQVDFLQELLLHDSSQLLELRLVWEVKQNVCQLHVPVHYI